MNNINNNEFDNLTFDDGSADHSDTDIDFSADTEQFEEESYGSQIKELRLKMKLTQVEVARKMNVTPGYISNVENNRTAMSLKMLIFYARLLHMPLDTLVGKLDPTYKSTALNNELSSLISSLDDDAKQKLIETIKIWTA